MNKSKHNFSFTKDSNKVIGFIPFLAGNSTVEELDERIIAMGGRKLPPKESLRMEIESALKPGFRR